MQHDVFRFDVAVDDAEGVDFVDCLADLLHDEGYSRFWEWLCLLELVVELSP